MTEVWPLSPLQEGLLFHAAFDDLGDHGDHGDHGPDVYTVQTVLAADGPVDPARLRASWEALVLRHAALRASFHRRRSGEAVQLITREVALPWRETDLSGLAEPEAAAETGRLAAAERAHRVDPAAPPLLRLHLIRRAPDRYRLVVTSHHLLMDGWSMPLLLDELTALYAAGGDASGLRTAPSYRDYLLWLGRQDKDAARAAWRAELAGTDEPTLVAGPVTAARAGAAPRRTSLRLPGATATALGELARRHGLTVNTVLQGAWALVLARLTGRTDVVFGSTVAGRPPELPGAEAMIGLFINTLPVRIRLDGAEPVVELLRRIQERQSALIAHQHLGLAEIQGIAGPGAGFDTLMVYENYPRPPADPATPETLRLTVAEAHQATHYPLTVGVLPGDGFRLDVTYRPDLVSERVGETAGRWLARVLERMVVDPWGPVGRLDVLEPADRARVVDGWGGTPGAEPVLPVPELVAGRVAAEPKAVAVSGEGRAVSYRELGEGSGRLAAFLAGVGVGRGDRVGVVLERSVGLPVVLLGVWRAGAAYVPVDVGWPAERVAGVLADAGVSVVLCERKTRGVVPESSGALVLEVDQPETVARLAASPGGLTVPVG
ncbi:AMP-binding protein, partial [Streptomyces sp. PLAI1-29]|nr:AMP-binding protein [Streptomyces zingiberis]